MSEPKELEIPDVVFRAYAEYQDECAGRDGSDQGLLDNSDLDDEIKIGGTD